MTRSFVQDWCIGGFLTPFFPSPFPPAAKQQPPDRHLDCVGLKVVCWLTRRGGGASAGRPCQTLRGSRWRVRGLSVHQRICQKDSAIGLYSRCRCKTGPHLIAQPSHQSRRCRSGRLHQDVSYQHRPIRECQRYRLGRVHRRMMNQ